MTLLYALFSSPESSHTIRVAVELDREAKRKNEEQTLIYNLSGHCLLEITGYGNYFKPCPNIVIEV